MKLFKDSQGREWSIVVNVESAERVRDLTTVDLFKLYQSETERVFSDPILFVNVLYALCKPQCDEAGVTDVQFGRAMTGDALEAAANGLLEEVADFFPTSRRTILRELHNKSKVVAEQLEAKAMEALAKLDTATFFQQPTK